MMASAKFDTLDAPWSTTVSVITRWDVAVRRFEAGVATGLVPSWSVLVIPSERLGGLRLAARSAERRWFPMTADPLPIPCCGARGRQCRPGPRHQPRGGDGEPAQGVDQPGPGRRAAPGGLLRRAARGARRRGGAPG